MTEQGRYFQKKPASWPVSVVLFILAVGLFLLSIDLVGASVALLGQDTAQSILLATSNPFIGLFIGLLATALIQSSSTVTAMTVAVVASGYLSLGNAIPVVMGANVGTTLTSTFVSLGYVTNRNEFRKAISAGTIHDFFNIFTVLLIFPLEYYYGTLSYLATRLTAIFGRVGGEGNAIQGGFDIGATAVSEWLIGIFPSNIITLFIALILLFLSIKFLSNIIYSRLIGQSKDKLKKFVFNNPYKSFGWGTLITAGVQSSSITTSLMVPLVASGRVKLTNSFPFVLGANIGTTITALLAAFNKSDAAISLAFVHLLFNLIGVIIFLPWPALRRIPVLAAYRFGALMLGSRAIGFSYILVTFFLLPFALIYANRSPNDQSIFEYRIKNESTSGVLDASIQVTGKDSNQLQYLVFLGDDNTLPDTSFSANGSGNFVATTSGKINYDPASGNFGSYGRIISLKDSSFQKGEISFPEATFIKVLSGNDTAHYLIDKKSKAILSAIQLRANGELLKSYELVSVQ